MRHYRGLVVAAIPPMKEGGRHWQDHIDLINVKAGMQYPFQPIDKIVPQPDACTELERVYEFARIALKTDSACRPVEMRSVHAAILAEELAVKPRDVAPAATAASVYGRKRNPVEAIRADVPPRTVRRTSADLASAGPEDV